MSDTVEAKGQCLCGKVKVTAKTVNPKLFACHCDMCRKLTSGPVLALACGSEVFFEGEDNISKFNSSDWAERGFCKTCGTALFYRLKEKNLYNVTVGLFDKIEGIEFVSQIFIDKKPSYYCFANETKNMTGAEVFAKYT